MWPMGACLPSAALSSVCTDTGLHSLSLMLPFNLFPLTVLIYLSLLFISFMSWVSEQTVNSLRAETMPSEWRADHPAQVSESRETKRAVGLGKETHQLGRWRESRKPGVWRREGRGRRVWPGAGDSACCQARV